MKYRIEIEQDEDGMFTASVPSLPGCISEGATRMEAIENVKDAAQGYIESLRKHNEPIPPPIDEEVIELFDLA
ncbi:MAG: type II toxin-antitoxin system HicB family antitoxin [Candidatus Kapaibacterium sp.]